MIIKFQDGHKRTVHNWEDLPLVLDRKTVALILGVSEQTVWNWLKSGQLQANRIGRSYLIDREYLRSIVQGPGIEMEVS